MFISLHILKTCIKTLIILYFFFHRPTCLHYVRNADAKSSTRVYVYVLEASFFQIAKN
jgi:hypothetical protein